MMNRDCTVACQPRQVAPVYEGKNDQYWGRIVGFKEVNKYKLALFGGFSGRSPESQSRVYVPQSQNFDTGSLFHKISTEPLGDPTPKQMEKRDLLFYTAAMVAQYPFRFVLSNGQQTDLLMGSTLDHGFEEYPQRMEFWQNYFRCEPDDPHFTSRISLMGRTLGDHVTPQIIMSSVSKEYHIVSDQFNVLATDGISHILTTYDGKHRGDRAKLMPFDMSDGELKLIQSEIVGDTATGIARSVYDLMRVDQVGGSFAFVLDIKHNLSDMFVVNRHEMPEKYRELSEGLYEQAKA